MRTTCGFVSDRRIVISRKARCACSLTVTGFYKKLNNSISFGQFARSFTNNGSTQTVQILGPSNSDEGGKLMGVEAGFQTFFDFLPGLLSGLGTQLNYTFVHQSDIDNSNLLNASSSANVGAVGAGQPALGGTGSADLTCSSVSSQGQ